jgi:hypothetical protein
MWFVLDDSLTQLDVRDVDTLAAIEQLFHAVARGEHAVAGSTNVARHLFSAQLSARPKAAVQQVFSYAAEFMARARATKFRLRIVSEPAAPARISEGEWSLPINWIGENGVPSSCVLGENLRDAKLYRQCAEHYMLQVKQGNSLFLDVLSGGGADTPHIFENETVARRRLVFCLTDSDRCCPDAEASLASKRCSAIALEAPWASTHVALSAREMENFLPRNIVIDALTELNSPDISRRLDQLIKIGEHSPAAWDYFDLKEGTSLQQMFGACGTFWANLKDHEVCALLANCDCLEESKCCAKSAKECTCLIAPSLCHNVVDHVIAYVDKQSRHSVVKRISTSTNSIQWHQLGALLSSWGAATPKERS